MAKYPGAVRSARQFAERMPKRDTCIRRTISIAVCALGGSSKSRARIAPGGELTPRGSQPRGNFYVDCPNRCLARRMNAPSPRPRRLRVTCLFISSKTVIAPYLYVRGDISETCSPRTRTTLDTVERRISELRYDTKECKIENISMNNQNASVE